jgi:hypothetical protein
MDSSKKLTGWTRAASTARTWEPVPLAPAPESNSIWSIITPADGTRAANVGTGDFGTSPIFVQLSDKPLLASVYLFGVPERKAQWRVKNKQFGLRF